MNEARMAWKQMGIKEVSRALGQFTSDTKLLWYLLHYEHYVHDLGLVTQISRGENLFLIWDSTNLTY